VTASRIDRTRGRAAWSKAVLCGLAAVALVLLARSAPADMLYMSFDDGSIRRLNDNQTFTLLASGLRGAAGLAVDPAVQDTGMIDRIAPDHTVTVLATGLQQPTALAIDRNDNLYTTDGFGGSVQKITPAGVVSTFATGVGGTLGLAFDQTGNLYVANDNTSQATVSRITPGGVVTTYARGLRGAAGLAFDSAGNLYVGEQFAADIKRIAPDGTTSIFAGNVGGHELAFGASGDLYDTAGGEAYVRITPAGQVTTIGTGGIAPMFVTAVAPEPSSALTWGLGCVVLLACRYRGLRHGMESTAKLEYD